MNALLLALVLTCGPQAHGENGSCACGKHAEQAKAPPTTEETGACHHGPAQAAAAKTEATLITRGEKLQGLGGVELTRLLAKPAEFDGKTVALEGTVRRACTSMGCWMELAPAEKGPGVRVTFKDGGFFVPLDSAGAKARVEGTVKVAVLAPERAKHSEAEGATVTKGKDGASREVQLVASGVELRR